MGCGAYAGGDARATPEELQWLCLSCRDRLQPDRPRCVACGVLSPSGRTCYPCLPSTPLQGVLALGRYADPPLESGIKLLKFHGARPLARVFGALLARRILAAGLGRALPRNDAAVPPLPPEDTPIILVPLPLHPRRERARGYNQAQLLADTIGETLGLPVRPLLVRARATFPQTSILEYPEARRRNVSGAFAIRSPASGGRLPDAGTRRVILIDDVLTTGATVSEAGMVLRTAGVGEIWAAVVARA